MAPTATTAAAHSERHYAMATVATPAAAQRQHPQNQLISYDSDGGWVRGGINGGAGVPPPSGDGGGQQRYIGGHGSVD